MNWKNRIVVLAGIVSSWVCSAQRPQTPLLIETIRQDLFSSELPPTHCLRLFPQAIPLSAKKTLDKVLGAVRTLSGSSLAAAFHPRLKMTEAQMDQALLQIKLGLQAPLEVSLHRFWAIQNQNEQTDGLACPYTTEIELYPQYGYPLMFGVWIQILGQEDLGRIFMTLVPHEDRWVLGGFHYVRWSYHGKSYEHLLQKGDQRRVVNNKVSARMWFDLAGKYLSGAGLYELPIQREIFELRDQVLSSKEWRTEIQKSMPSHRLKHVASLFTIDGFGLLLRTEIPEKPGESLTEKCASLLKEIEVKNPAWWKDVEGVRCSFILPGESEKTEGRLGYIYLPTHKKN